MTEMQITAEPGVPQVLTERTFDAPRDLVFRAFTEPELLVQWLGPRKYTMTIERFDLRDGGTWRYIHSDDAGNAFGFHGVFHGEPSPDGMVQTFEFEGAPGHVSMDTLTLEENDGRTTVRTNSAVPVGRGPRRDGRAGMADGMSEGYERLDELARQARRQQLTHEKEGARPCRRSHRACGSTPRPRKQRTSTSRSSRTRRSPTSQRLDGTPSGDNVALVFFRLAGLEFMAINGGPQFPFTEAVSFNVTCKDQDEVDRLWSR